MEALNLMVGTSGKYGEFLEDRCIVNFDLTEIGIASLISQDVSGYC